VESDWEVFLIPFPNFAQYKFITISLLGGKEFILILG
jgi:hypothetical protein